LLQERIRSRSATVDYALQRELIISFVVPISNFLAAAANYFFGDLGDKVSYFLDFFICNIFRADFLFYPEFSFRALAKF